MRVPTSSIALPLCADLWAIGIGAREGTPVASQSRDRGLKLLSIAIIGVATGFGGGTVRDVVRLGVPPTPNAIRSGGHENSVA